MLLLLLFSLLPQPTIATDRVDCIEVNHFHDDHARHVFTQVIYRDSCHEIVEWRLLKRIAMHPRRDYAAGDYSAIWHDDGKLREVRCGVVSETWTQHDPELVERSVLDKERRRGLRK